MSFEQRALDARALFEWVVAVHESELLSVELGPGLLGAVYTLAVPGTNQRINLLVGRLEALDGTPREDFLPRDC